MQKGIDGAKDFDAAAGALNQNTDDLTASIGSVYGSEAAQQFKRFGRATLATSSTMSKQQVRKTIKHATWL